MIAKLSGILDRVGRDHAVIDVGGVGYLVRCSSRTLANLSGVGAPVSLAVETMVREDAIELYGFAEASERDWFRLLLTVQGVGAKVAMALLSALAADQLASALAAGDTTTSAPSSPIAWRASSRRGRRRLARSSRCRCRAQVSRRPAPQPTPSRR